MVRLYGGGSGVLALCFSPDGRLLARGAYDEKVELWDVASATRTRVYDRHRRSVYAVAFHPDGRRLASGDGEAYEKPGRLALWDLDGHTAAYVRITHDTVSGLAWRPDGQLLAACDFAGTVHLLDPADGRELEAFAGRLGPLNAVLWEPSRENLLIAGERGVQRLDARGHSLGLFAADHGAVNALALAADGHIATAGEDGALRVWRPGGQLLLALPHSGAVQSVAFAPDGRWVAAASADRTLSLWDAASGRALARHELPGPVSRVAAAPDGRLLAAGLGRFHGEGELLLIPAPATDA
jgi:WD40 repeat protein